MCRVHQVVDSENSDLYTCSSHFWGGFLNDILEWFAVKDYVTFAASEWL